MNTLRPVFEGLAEIRLFGCTLDQQLYSIRWVAELVAAARNLQTFKYICDTSVELITGYGWHKRPWYSFLGMLKAARGSLRHLTIDLDGTQVRATSHTMVIDPWEIGEIFQLETLEIDQFCYCKHQLGRENLEDKEWDRKTYLADFLPTTIDAPIIPDKIFSAEDDEKEENNWNGKLDTIPAELEGQACRFKEAFEGSGVVTRFRIWKADSSVFDTWDKRPAPYPINL
ncbi:unnamed protein product [Fusarium venenatum]|uniref:Uncharacterized protein n=1 Tax=Fusarium venenatum TaxID=56646 RepID=A0A2L2TBH6_9HYPO|nr:uncharacterized protein FVRRES_04732 [Fusarium venenatum]CEI60296.1 unnamed protein product [Fusarium venenatum]